MDRLSQLIAIDSVETNGFDDAIAQNMPPTWRSPLSIGTGQPDAVPSNGSSFRIAEPFNSPASLIRGELDLLWNWYLKQDLHFDDVAGQTGEIVSRLHVRRETGTIRDWLPACMTHLLACPYTSSTPRN